MASVLGIDSSTQSTKVQRHDLDTGALVGEGRAPHPPTQPPRSEQDPAAWWAALGAATSEALDAAGADHGALVGVAVAGQQHGLVPLDAAGAVLS